ncbi:MAG: hypothetical protein ACHQUC_09025 [Chlamydiales bacterium]
MTLHNVTSTPYLKLDALKRFLKLKNWRLMENSTDTSLMYEGPVDDRNCPTTLVLPANAEFADTQSVISKAVRLLAAIERSSTLDLEEVINNLGSDFLRQRIITPSNSHTISLSMAKEAIDNLTDLISYSACLEESAQPFFVKGRSIGKKFIEKCRFGQTFVGSFGFALEMPILPSLPGNSLQMPLERRIMMRIANGLFSIRKAAQEADISILTNNYKQGFNANLLETMQNLIGSFKDFPMEFSFAWSPEYTLPAELKAMPILRLTSESVLPLLESAAKALRRSSESEDTVITGKIVQLRGEICDEGDDLEVPDNKMIIIERETERGRSSLIRAALSPEEYRCACDAHRDGKTVSIRGKPEKLGKYLILTSPLDFKILPDSEFRL